MSISSSDIQYYKSSNPNSDGGTITATAITDNTLNNVFPDIDPKEASGKYIIYRKIFVKNNHATLTWQNAIFYRSSDTTIDTDEVHLGLGTDKDADGDAITYYSGSSLNLGSLNPGEAKGLWLKRVVTPGYPYKTTNQGTITCEGGSA